MSRLGMADMGIATFNDMLQNAAMIASVKPGVPVIADADTGYGGPLNVANTVRQYARAGIAGLHIEDQVPEKRCGHLSGKLLVTRGVFASRLRAACKARDQTGLGIVIIARTDARAGVDLDGNTGFDEAIRRLRMAVEIGVDALFFEAPQSEQECAALVRSLPDVPILLNMVQGGVTPLMTSSKAQQLGFRMTIWPLVAIEAAVPAVEHVYEGLKRNATDLCSGSSSPSSSPLGPKKLFELCGLQALLDFDAGVAGGKVMKPKL